MKTLFSLIKPITILVLYFCPLEGYEYRFTDLFNQGEILHWSDNYAKLNDHGQVVFLTQTEDENDNPNQGAVYFFDPGSGCKKINGFTKNIEHLRIIDLSNQGDFIGEHYISDIKRIGCSYYVYYQEYGVVDFTEETQKHLDEQMSVYHLYLLTFYSTNGEEWVFTELDDVIDRLPFSTAIPYFINDRGTVIGITDYFIPYLNDDTLFTYNLEEGFKSHELPVNHKISDILSFSQNGSALVKLDNRNYRREKPHVESYVDDEYVYAMFDPESGFTMLGDFGIAEAIRWRFPHLKWTELVSLKMNEQGTISGYISNLWVLVEDAAIPFIYNPEFGLRLIVEDMSNGTTHYFAAMDSSTDLHDLNNLNQFLFTGYECVTVNHISPVSDRKHHNDYIGPYVWSLEDGFSWIPNFTYPEEKRAKLDDNFSRTYSNYYSINDLGQLLGKYEIEGHDRNIVGCLLWDKQNGLRDLEDLIDLQGMRIVSLVLEKINPRGEFLIETIDDHEKRHLLLIAPIN